MAKKKVVAKNDRTLSSEQKSRALTYFNTLDKRRDVSEKASKGVPDSDGYISTGCKPLDYVFGGKGIPRGRVIEIYGGESTGKSTLAMSICRVELENNPDVICLYEDYERSTAEQYARDLGLGKYADRFHLIDPDSLEEGDNIKMQMMDNKVYPSIVVIDSVAAMTPKSAINRDLAVNAKVAEHARMMSDYLAKWTKRCADHGITMILINQTRTYIETERFHSNQRKVLNLPGVNLKTEDTPGGKAVKFYASVRLRLEGKKVVTQEIMNPLSGEIERIPVANIVKAQTIKNKTAKPFKSCQFFIKYGYGIDRVRTMVEVAKERKLITCPGGRYKFTKTNGEDYKVHGEAKFFEALYGDLEAQDELERVLGWDTEIAPEVLGTSTIDLATGKSEVDEDDDTAEELEILMTQPTVTHKAFLLEIIKPLGRGKYAYTTEEGEDIQAGSLDELDGMFSEEIKSVLRSKVEAEIKEMESQKD